MKGVFRLTWQREWIHNIYYFSQDRVILEFVICICTNSKNARFCFIKQYIFSNGWYFFCSGSKAYNAYQSLSFWWWLLWLKHGNKLFNSDLEAQKFLVRVFIAWSGYNSFVIIYVLGFSVGFRTKEMLKSVMRGLNANQVLSSFAVQ